MSDLLGFDFDVVTVDAKGEETARHRRSAYCRMEPLESGIALRMVAIPSGTFIMGAPDSEMGWSTAQSPQRLVGVPAFSISQHPITQAQWQAVAQLPKIDRPLNSSPANARGELRPVEQISWYDAVEFCARLSQQTDRSYRLPSEAEWEYACRAGTSTPFHFGETCTAELANYSGIDWEYEGRILSYGAYGAGPLGLDRRETTDVGYFQVANAFGLYDMHGNVREWCADVWHSSYAGAPADAIVWTTPGDPSKRVLRGGSWNVGPRQCRSAFRSRFDATASLYDIGFRVVCE